jgi:hypothetical protein
VSYISSTTWVIVTLLSMVSTVIVVLQHYTHVTQRGGHIVAGRRVFDGHLAVTDRTQLQSFLRSLNDFQLGQIQPLFQSRFEPMVVALGRQAFVVGCVKVFAVSVNIVVEFECQILVI